MKSLLFSLGILSASLPLFSDEEMINCPPIYNIPGMFRVQDPLCVFLTADFLYWQAKEDNLDYGVTSIQGGQKPILDGKVLHMDFDWHPGVKMGLGLNFNAHDHWDLLVEWTYLNSHNNTETTFPRSETGSIFPSLLPPNVIGLAVASSAKANYKLLYNTFDFDLGRPFYSGELLRLRPHGGLRGTYFRQKYSASYRIVSASTETITITTIFNSWGIGPRVGMGSDWFLGCGCKIFGNVGFSLLYTKFNTREKGQDTGIFSDGTVVIVPNSYIDKKRHNQVRPNMEATLGMGWEWYFDDCNWHADFTLGYEFQYWPDANGDVHYFDSIAQGVHGTGGNLALHGLTFMARLDF